MRLAVYLPLLASICFGIGAPALARRLPPAQATWMLTAGSLLLALSTDLSLGLLGSTYLARQPEIAELGHVAAATYRRNDPVDTTVAIAALVLVLVFAALLARVAVQRVRALSAAYRICRDLRGSATPLVVLPDLQHTAYAVPGRPGRIVVSQALLSALPAGERRALLAHERAHLDHRHHWHLAVVAIAAAMDPLLLRLPAVAGYSTERWADEIAAGAVGDRQTTAAALARTSLLRSSPAPFAAMCAARTRVTDRVGALMLCPPRNRPLLAFMAGLCVLAATAGVFEATRDAHALVELAQRTGGS